MTQAYELPAEIRTNVVEIFGDRGAAWLEALPAVVADLTERWQLRLGRSYTGGTHSLVLAVTRADGSPAVLKVPVLDDENYAEAAALRCYGGDGAVELYEVDVATGALLLERADPGTPLLDHPNRPEAIGIACALLRRLRRPATPDRDCPGPDEPATDSRRPVSVPSDRRGDHPYPHVTDLVARWAAEFPVEQKECGEPVPRRVLDRAVELATRYATEPDGPELLVNRDAHLGNMLSARREPWLLIDPKPLAGEAAFDTGHLMHDLLREAPGRAAALDTAARLADGLGVPTDRVLGWALVRAVDNALWAARDADPTQPYLAVAEAVAG